MYSTNGKKRKLVILLFFVGFGLFYSISSSYVYEVEQRLNVIDDTTPLEVRASAAHDPIHIDSDAAFISANGVVRGDGTPGNPYIIEGWEIDGLHGGYGIKIENTHSYVNIQNCDITNSQYGIWLYYADNVTITNCNIHDYEGTDGNDATVADYATHAETVFGIYSYSSKSTTLNIMNNVVSNLMGGRGGNGYPNSAYDHAYDGGTVYGIFVEGEDMLFGNILSNKIYNLKAGNGGNSEVSVEDTSGSFGGDGGNVFGIINEDMVGSISNNLIFNLKSGDGGDGGDAGDTDAGDHDGRQGGRGGSVGLVIGIEFKYVNQYSLYKTSDDSYSNIQNNTISGLVGGVGGNGGDGGDSSNLYSGGDGGAGGPGGIMYPFAIDYSQCLIISHNRAYNLTSGLYGLGGVGGYSFSIGSNGGNGNHGWISGYKLNNVVDGIMELNTVYDMFYHPHDLVGRDFGLDLSYCYNFQITANNFEAEDHFIHESDQITLNTLLYGNYWGLFPGALDVSPKDGYMDIPYVIPSANITDYRPLAYPTDSDTDGDSISLLDELMVGSNPRINEAALADLLDGNGSFGDVVQDYGTLAGTGFLGIAVIVMGLVKRK